MNFKNKVFVGSGAALVIIILYLVYSISYTKDIIAGDIFNDNFGDETVINGGMISSSTAAYHYIEIINSCDANYVGECVNMRSGPGVEYPVTGKLRNGVVLNVENTIVNDSSVDVEKNATNTKANGWYKVIFKMKLAYPERVKGDNYVAVDINSILPIENIGVEMLTASSSPTSKRIKVDISSNTLSAYDGDALFMTSKVSTGLADTPTPIGNFRVFKKTPSRYMQGSSSGVGGQYYDLPGVPWDLYFTADGAVIHGAYWHNKFGKPWSHGCINLSLQEAKKLYLWADIGTYVSVER